MNRELGNLSNNGGLREKPTFEGLGDKAGQAVSPRLEKLAKRADLFFHNVGHTERVVARYITILDALKEAGCYISPRDRALGEVGAWFHDVVQDYKKEKKSVQFSHDGEEYIMETMRRKKKDGNEADSANTAIVFLHEVYGSNMNLSDEELVRDQIMSTVPKFDPESIITQENLRPESKYIDFALALADLGTSGMQPKEFVADSDALFREDNLDILQNLTNPAKQLSLIEQEFYRKRILDWCEMQIEFPAKRKLQVMKELCKMDNFKNDETKLVDFMQQVFPGFDEAARLMATRTNNRMQMDFQELISDMGYAQSVGKNTPS